jgi:hypothetical protein
MHAHTTADVEEGNGHFRGDGARVGNGTDGGGGSSKGRGGGAGDTEKITYVYPDAPDDMVHCSRMTSKSQWTQKLARTCHQSEKIIPSVQPHEAH